MLVYIHVYFEERKGQGWTIAVLSSLVNAPHWHGVASCRNSPTTIALCAVRAAIALALIEPRNISRDRKISMDITGLIAFMPGVHGVDMTDYGQATTR